MNQSKTINELKIGDSESLTLTLTEAHVEAFAKATGDYNPIHMNADGVWISFDIKLSSFTICQGFLSGYIRYHDYNPSNK